MLNPNFEVSNFIKSMTKKTIKAKKEIEKTDFFFVRQFIKFRNKQILNEIELVFGFY